MKWRGLFFGRVRLSPDFQFIQSSYIEHEVSQYYGERFYFLINNNLNVKNNV